MSGNPYEGKEKDVVEVMRAYLKTRTFMSIEDGGQMTSLPTWLVNKVIKQIEDCTAKKS